MDKGAIGDTGGWIFITLPYATFAVEFAPNGEITEAPPIARWMMGKRTWDVLPWVKKKKGQYVFLGKEQ